MTNDEYIATNEDAIEAMWMSKFIDDLSVVSNLEGRVEIFCDNEGAIILNKDPKAKKRTWHILKNPTSENLTKKDTS